jgi:hypothetical protein
MSGFRDEAMRAGASRSRLRVRHGQLGTWRVRASSLSLRARRRDDGEGTAVGIRTSRRLRRRRGRGRLLLRSLLDRRRRRSGRRVGRRHGSRSRRCERRRGCRSRRRHSTGVLRLGLVDRGRRLPRDRRVRQERERVEVALWVGGATDTEVEVGLGELDIARRPNRPHGVSLDELRTLGDADRSKVRQRDRVPVCGADRDALAGARNGSGKGDRPGRRRDNRRSPRRANVDAAMLAGSVGVCRVEDIRLQDRSLGRPGPGTCHRCEMKRGDDRRQECSAHVLPLEIVSGRPLHVPSKTGTCVLEPR